MNDPAAKPPVSAGSWSDAAPLVKKRFTGPSGATAALRADFTKAAWADVMQHARESLEAEVCGVLIGQVCAGPTERTGNEIARNTLLPELLRDRASASPGYAK